MEFSGLPYPNIASACFRIALDNDGINRERTERDWTREYRRFIAQNVWPESVLADIDQWLSGLTVADLSIVCCGDEADAMRVLQSAPAATHKLLEVYFDEVC